MSTSATPVTPDSSETAFSDAWESFFRAARSARRRTGGGDGSCPLSLPQFQLIEPLTERPRKVKELAAAAGISAPTATRTLDGLAEKGLVERHASDEDRRCVLVALTDDGRHALSTKEREVAAMRHRVANLLNDEERAQATRLLQRLADALEDL
ncbi:MAG TPA: MarR family transcriptional regulator [Solirubrobacteraceae bacterium]|nr:MarR family transcriptional regulator [Solirubrobacteraceae bacterium]